MKLERSNNKAPVKWLPWLTAFFVLLAGAAGVLIWVFLAGKTEVTLSAPSYQYFASERVEFDAGTKLRTGSDNVVLAQASDKIDGDTSPVYAQSENSMYIPVDMSWTDPTTGKEWRVAALTKIEIDEAGAIWCDTADGQINLPGGFMTDGEGMFVLLDPSVLRWNGEVTDLGSFSFFSTTMGLIRVFNYQSGEIESTEQLYGSAVVSTGRGYQLDLISGVYTAADGSRRLLAATPGVLSPIEDK